jgi:sulfur carrier protein
VKVNGATVALENNQSLLSFLEQKKYETAKIVVERNGEIVPKSKYKEVFLSDSDKLEIVSFVGGG